MAGRSKRTCERCNGPLPPSNFANHGYPHAFCSLACAQAKARTCRCDRPIDDGEGWCVLCGRDLPAVAA